MRFWKETISIGMVVLILFFGLFSNSTIASLNPQQVGENGKIDNGLKSAFERMNDVANTTSEITDSKRIQDIKNLIDNAISNNEVVMNGSEVELDFSNAKFLKITQNDTDYTSATIPITGDQYSFTSNFTLIFDSNNEIINYSEILVTKSDNNKFVITSFSDGKLTHEEETDLDYVSNSELEKQLADLQASLEEGNQQIQPEGIKEVAACIALIASVDLVVAYLIAGTCAASCPAVPPVCAACIAAVATLGVANIAGIVGCFNLL
ncbi:hypothetical protein [Caldalkalibacillus mannanilyticus]|uniref:hypothetical protein n=1 Tax=Caldalkalibacillus mannanilyticus TaxID=1418 RepID=UPI000468ED89|nr:hypothetical protein [Caldalkalibacillus mannanilyticus]